MLIDKKTTQDKKIYTIRFKIKQLGAHANLKIHYNANHCKSMNSCMMSNMQLCSKVNATELHEKHHQLSDH